MSDLSDLPDLEDTQGQLTEGLSALAESKARDLLTEDVVRDVTILGGSVLVGLGIKRLAESLSQNQPED